MCAWCNRWRKLLRTLVKRPRQTLGKPNPTATIIDIQKCSDQHARTGGLIFLSAVVERASNLSGRCGHPANDFRVCTTTEVP